MKLKLTPIFIALCVAAAYQTPAFADSKDSSTDIDQALQKINQRSQTLEQEIKRLQAQVKLLKQQQHKTLAIAQSSAKVAPVIPEAHLNMLGIDAFQTPVTTAPYVGIPSSYKGSHLLVENDSSNQDLVLLQHQQQLENAYKKAGLAIPENLGVKLSGSIEGQASVSNPYAGNKTSNLNLTGVELNIAPTFNPWVSGLASITYDNTVVSPVISNNARLMVRRAFVTVGNLNQSPFYATFGQLYLPFGQFASNMLSTPLTQLIGRMTERGVILGYNQNGLYSSLFAFRGDSSTSNTTKINQMGVNAGYTYNFGEVKTDIGASYIGNLADADGIQQTGGTGSVFSGFGSSTSTEIIQHRVPGLGVHGSLNTGPFGFMAEYIGATRTFAATDLSYQSRGAQPEAANLEASYNFTAMNKPTTAAIGYGVSREALALNLPRERYIASLSTSMWKDTIQTLEFRHDKNYGVNTQATGMGLANPSSANGWLGKSLNQITLQFGVYF